MSTLVSEIYQALVIQYFESVSFKKITHVLNHWAQSGAHFTTPTVTSTYMLPAQVLFLPTLGVIPNCTCNLLVNSAIEFGHRYLNY